MKYEFLIADVFSRTAFGGNQLAVLPDAAGLSANGMQVLAREFNFAESTFVQRVDRSANAFRIRIFTPKEEVVFAGHPTIGTACALAMRDGLSLGDKRDLILEEGIGPVRVGVENRGGTLHGTLSILGNVQTPPVAPDSARLAEMLLLNASDIQDGFFERRITVLLRPPCRRSSGGSGATRSDDLEPVSFFCVVV
jgi:trans-2,3-dihydro-3-hydroxyanthranilate isomerase